MHRMWLRAGLVAVALAAAAASGARIIRTEPPIADARAAQHALSARAWELQVALSDLRAAQHAYVAVGQDRADRAGGGGALVNTITAGLADLAAQATAPAAISALDDAAAAAAALAQVDAQARGHALGSRDLMASDLVFEDAPGLAREAADHLDRARQAERAARDTAIAAQRREQGTTAAAALGVALLVALLLAPRRRPAAGAAGGAANADAGDDAPRETGPTTTGAPGAAGRLLFDDEADAGGAAAPDPTPSAPSTEGPAAPDAPHPDAPAPDLQRAADLCTDLGRCANAAELPPLLERAAALLNARGLVIWVQDGRGATLRPALGHGYPAATLTRLGAIAADADNITAAAWRETSLQVAPAADDGTPGAVAAPLVAAEQCGGVLALELGDGWESSAAVQSTAVILAAQLATLITPDPPSAESAGSR